MVRKGHTSCLLATMNLFLTWGVGNGGPKKDWEESGVKTNWRSPACPGLMKSMYPGLKSNCLIIIHSNTFISTDGSWRYD